MCDKPEPEAIRHSFDGHGWQYIDSGSGSDWIERGMAHPDAEKLFDASAAPAQELVTMPLMRRAFRTTVSCGSERRYEMVFKFPDLNTLHAADDEWIAAADTSPAPVAVSAVDDWPGDGSCIRCGAVPRHPVSGLCNTCLDEDAERAGEITTTPSSSNPVASTPSYLLSDAQLVVRFRAALRRISEMARTPVDTQPDGTADQFMLGYQAAALEAVRIANEAIENTKEG